MWNNPIIDKLSEDSESKLADNFIVIRGKMCYVRNVNLIKASARCDLGLLSKDKHFGCYDNAECPE